MGKKERYNIVTWKKDPNRWRKAEDYEKKKKERKMNKEDETEEKKAKQE